jgi:hypothetical protein
MGIRLELKPTPGQQNALVGVLAVIGVLAAYNWAIRPHVSSLRAAQQYRWATGERMELGESISDGVVAEQDRLQTLRAERAAFSALAFSPEEAVQFHNDLQALCRETACSVAWLSYGNDENVARYGARGAVSAMVVRSASLTIHGAYGSIVKFLGELRSRPQKIWIDSLEVTTLPSRPDRVVCDLTITICVDQDKGSTR